MKTNPVDQETEIFEHVIMSLAKAPIGEQFTDVKISTADPHRIAYLLERNYKESFKKVVLAEAGSTHTFRFGA